jgi:hypothetical protein
MDLREQLGRRLIRRRVVGLLAGQPTRHATDHPIEDRQQGRRSTSVSTSKDAPVPSTSPALLQPQPPSGCR